MDFGQFVIVQRQKVVGKNSRAHTGRDIYKIYRTRLRLIFAQRIYMKMLNISLEVAHGSKKETFDVDLMYVKRFKYHHRIK